jgi:hypothetical protein
MLMSLQVPSTEAEWQRVADEFEQKWNFSNCIGALDGKRINLQAPINSGSFYYDYKQNFSVILMALVDANYNFLYVDVGANGRQSDGAVFANCSLSTALENNCLNVPPPKVLTGSSIELPFVVVADDAFPMKSYLMKPYPG